MVFNCIEPPATERLADSLDRLAMLTGVCRRTLDKEIAEGRLKATKIGRRTLVTREDSLAWLRNAPRRP